LNLRGNPGIQEVSSLEIIRDPATMQLRSRDYLVKEKTIGLVPTMGALHNGHLSLITRSLAENDVTVVSIFVNPTQFGPTEDFENYPRDIEGDIAKLEGLGVDILFLPDTEGMYPPDHKTYVEVEDISTRLCGEFRPGHFRGVTTVVTKLFNIVRPQRSYFGQKDYQQTLVIRRLVRDLNIDTRVIVCPTVREEDGLAMSSRNAYLSEDARRAAAIIYRTLSEAEENLHSGMSPAEVAALMKKRLSSEKHIREVQYASVYDPESLDDLSSSDGNIKKDGSVLLAAAVVIGDARLIDNMLVKINGGS
jgi:pantoate--beta-alanine ligase